jgi:hypothetical protein
MLLLFKRRREEAEQGGLHGRWQQDVSIGPALDDLPLEQKPIRWVHLIGVLCSRVNEIEHDLPLRVIQPKRIML